MDEEKKNKQITWIKPHSTNRFRVLFFFFSIASCDG